MSVYSFCRQELDVIEKLIESETRGRETENETRRRKRDLCVFLLTLARMLRCLIDHGLRVIRCHTINVTDF